MHDIIEKAQQWRDNFYPKAEIVWITLKDKKQYPIGYKQNVKGSKEYISLPTLLIAELRSVIRKKRIEIHEREVLNNFYGDVAQTIAKNKYPGKIHKRGIHGLEVWDVVDLIIPIKF